MARGDRQFVRVNVSSAVDKVRAVEKQLAAATEALQIEAAEAGRDKMREIIETSGTGRAWQRSHYAKDGGRVGTLRRGSFGGRVNTGNMRDSVSVRFEGRGANRVAAFGWIRNFEDYFGYQDQGFLHVISGKRVAGMFALRDARRYVVNQVLPRLTRKYARRIERGVDS